ncbi:MAG: AraC family transcriptional regulator [Lonepinella koalarum]|nr:AraC family transcriptional regulator [Lonepinella koalarum]
MLFLYPLDSLKTNQYTEAEQIPWLWQQEFPNLLGNYPHYGVYHHYQNQEKGDFYFTIALETKNENTPLIIDESIWYEVFPTTNKQRNATWKSIKNKAKQGLLKRAYLIDFEKYLPEGKMEIYISILPHC